MRLELFQLEKVEIRDPSCKIIGIRKSGKQSHSEYSGNKTFIMDIRCYRRMGGAGEVKAGKRSGD